jgi:nitroreductase
MKTKLSLLILTLILSLNLNGQTTGSCVVDAIMSGYSVRAYTSVPVTDQQLDLILKCGIKAPSARNNQPWRFTVIGDTATMHQIVKDAQPGNVLIVVSGAESNQTSVSVDFDCALATHSMFVAAEGLGLGARIYGSPVNNINSKREAFAIPAGFKPVIVLRVGNIDKSVDAVSAATPRKKVEEIINYKK